MQCIQNVQSDARGFENKAIKSFKRVHTIWQVPASLLISWNQTTPLGICYLRPGTLDLRGTMLCLCVEAIAQCIELPQPFRPLHKRGTVLDFRHDVLKLHRILQVDRDVQTMQTRGFKGRSIERMAQKKPSRFVVIGQTAHSTKPQTGALSLMATPSAQS